MRFDIALRFHGATGVWDICYGLEDCISRWISLYRYRHLLGSRLLRQGFLLFLVLYIPLDSHYGLIASGTQPKLQWRTHYLNHASRLLVSHAPVPTPHRGAPDSAILRGLRRRPTSSPSSGCPRVPIQLAPRAESLYASRLVERKVEVRTDKIAHHTRRISSPVSRQLRGDRHTGRVALSSKKLSLLPPPQPRHDNPASHSLLAAISCEPDDQGTAGLIHCSLKIHLPIATRLIRSYPTVRPFLPCVEPDASHKAHLHLCIPQYLTVLGPSDINVRADD